MPIDMDKHQDAMSRQFRQVAGLPERESDEPHDPLKPSELRRQAEPEGGYDGRGEPDEDDREAPIHDELVEELQKGEEDSAKSGQGVTTGADASTSTEATEAQADAAGKGDKPKPAKKAASKKAEGKK
jgi:hypothetical protein